MTTEYFLGANSGEGFCSLYEEYIREKGGFFRLIKGGPGGGKSGFMRRIGERAESLGYDVEYIRCSGDPSSLDAVYIIQLNVGYVDATSPHVTEPSVFGYNSDYVNLCQFCSRVESDDIPRLTKLYKSMYSIAYSYLKAAKEVKRAKIMPQELNFAAEKAKLRANSAVRQELGSKSKSIGSISRRYISGISCEGRIILKDTIYKLCKHIYLLDDRLGLEQFYLKKIIDNSRCEKLIVCPSPLDASYVEAVLIPERGLGFVASSLLPDMKPYRHVRLDALVSSDALRQHRSELRRREKLCTELMDTSVFYLKKAKEYHDMLELAYHPYIDFPALTEFTEQEISTLI